jgi:hypothetical protein
MKRGLCGREPEDQPACTSVHRGKFQDVAKKSEVAYLVLAVDDYVSSVDHGSSFGRLESLVDPRSWALRAIA